jgi:hypothetical protein
MVDMKITAALNTFVALTVVFTLSGCMSLGDAMTPNARIVTDPFDDSKHVSQPEVTTLSKFSDANNSLALRWFPEHPDSVVLIAGVQGVQNVVKLEINVDGDIIRGMENQAVTDYGARSKGSFVIKYDQLQQIANGEDIKFRVCSYKDCTMSGYVNSEKNSVFSRKIGPFVDLVEVVKNEG